MFIPVQNQTIHTFLSHPAFSMAYDMLMTSVKCPLNYVSWFPLLSQLLNQQLAEEKRVHMESEKFLQNKFEVGATLM